MLSPIQLLTMLSRLASGPRVMPLPLLPLMMLYWSDGDGEGVEEICGVPITLPPPELDSRTPPAPLPKATVCWMSVPIAVEKTVLL